MHKILVIRLYFPLDALLLCGYSHTAVRRMVSAHTKCDVQLIKLLLKMD